MTTIMLPADLEGALAKAARQRGTTPELLAIDTLRERFVQREPPEPKEGETLYDSLKDHIGTIDGTTEPLSENTGQRFAEILLEKRRQGSL